MLISSVKGLFQSIYSTYDLRRSYMASHCSLLTLFLAMKVPFVIVFRFLFAILSLGKTSTGAGADARSNI